MPKIRFVNEQITVDAQPGETLLDVAERSSVNVFRGIWPGLHCGAKVKGFCGRCKVWATPLAPGAVNEKTGSETRPLRLGGAIPKQGTLRLACEVKLQGDVEVRTRAGFVVPANATWEADPRPSKWRERWERRNDEPDEDEEKPKKKAAPAKPATKPVDAAGVATVGAAVPAPDGAVLPVPVKATDGAASAPAEPTGFAAGASPEKA